MLDERHKTQINILILLNFDLYFISLTNGNNLQNNWRIWLIIKLTMNIIVVSFERYCPRNMNIIR